VTRQRYEALEPCLMCHFSIGLPNAWAARLLATQKTWPGKIRRRRGLPVPSRAEANRRTAVRAGNAQPETWGKRRCVTPEDWQAWAFEVERKQVARYERTTDWSKGVSAYFLKHTLSKKLSAMRARMHYEKYKDTPELRFKRAMRNAVKRITRIAKVKKEGRTIEFIGCTMLHARKHIEKQFKKGMHWNNHGTVWHIDHIVPLSKFDLTDAMQRKRANHFTNLQPLYAHENMKKRDKITQAHQLALL
jgi:hypothetical protein